MADLNEMLSSFTRIKDLVGASGLSVTSLVFDPSSRTLFYTTNNADWRHLIALDR